MGESKTTRVLRRGRSSSTSTYGIIGSSVTQNYVRRSNAQRARSGVCVCSREVCAGGVCNTPSFLVLCASVYTGGLPQNKAATVHINNTEERGFLRIRLYIGSLPKPLGGGCQSRPRFKDRSNLPGWGVLFRRGFCHSDFGVPHASGILRPARGRWIAPLEQKKQKKAKAGFIPIFKTNTERESAAYRSFWPF